MRGYKHSVETRAKMSSASPIKGKTLDRDFVIRRAESRKSLGLKVSVEAKLRLREARLALGLRPWQNPAANKSVWVTAGQVAVKLSQGSRQCEILREYGLDPKSCAYRAVFKLVATGWNPSQDSDYMSWLATHNSA